jgi:hypothetical protein
LQLGGAGNEEMTPVARARSIGAVRLKVQPASEAERAIAALSGMTDNAHRQAQIDLAAQLLVRRA